MSERESGGDFNKMFYTSINEKILTTQILIKESSVSIAICFPLSSSDHSHDASSAKLDGSSKKDQTLEVIIY